MIMRQDKVKSKKELVVEVDVVAASLWRSSVYPWYRPHLSFLSYLSPAPLLLQLEVSSYQHTIPNMETQGQEVFPEAGPSRPSASPLRIVLQTDNRRTNGH